MAASRLVLMVALFLPGGAAEAQVQVAGWQVSCHDVSPKTYNMCTTAKRSDLPFVHFDRRFEIFWVRRVIEMYTPFETKISQYEELWHSGIIVKDVASGQTMLVQYEALNFEPDSFYPQVTPGEHLRWNNTAVVGWLIEPDMSQWTFTIKMGIVSGAVLNKWFDWVPGFAAAHPGYTLFSVWEKAGMFPAVRDKFEFFRDSCCHRFTEDGLRAFHMAGADFSAVTQPLCRNYFVMIKQDNLAMTTVDRGRTIEWRKVVGYYRDLNNVIKQISSLSTLLTARASFYKMVKKYGDNAYLADSDVVSTGKYHKVPLSDPYVTHVIQRMKLPWQTGGNQKECLSKEGVAMPESIKSLFTDSTTITV